MSAPDAPHAAPPSRLPASVLSRLTPSERVLGSFRGDWRPLAVMSLLFFGVAWGLLRNEGESLLWLLLLTAIAPFALWSQPLQAVVTTKRVLLVRAWPWEVTSEPSTAIVAIRRGPRWWIGGGVVVEWRARRAKVPQELRYFYPREPEAYRRALEESVCAAQAGGD